MLRFLTVLLILIAAFYLFAKFLVPAILLLIPGTLGTIVIAVIALIIIAYLLSRIGRRIL